MANKRTVRSAKSTDYSSVPATLQDHVFFGLRLDDQQKQFRDAIWSQKYDIIFCEGRAGTGKSTVAIATAVLMYKYGLVDGIHYLVNPTQQNVQGYIPGDAAQKTAPYMSALWSALEACNEIPQRAIRGYNMDAEKNGAAFVTAESTTFLRGSNIGGSSRKIVIIDEAQNYTVSDLRKTLTRVCDGSIVILIGQPLQCDLHNEKLSGFVPCWNHFQNNGNDRAFFTHLQTCHRSWVADVADQPW